MKMKRELLVTDPAILLNKISTNFPDLTWDLFKFLNHSWDFQVIILDNSIVFRFPTTKSLRDVLKREMEMLSLVKDIPNISIPRYTYIPKNGDFGGYALIPGEELTKQVIQRFTYQDLKSIANSIGVFLQNLHSTNPMSQLKDETSSLLTEDEILMKKSRLYLKNLLTPAQLETVIKVLEDVKSTRKSAYTKSLIHGDLYGRHIFWDNIRKNLGIIDFSDVSIGDPALDFAELFEYGATFTQDVYLSYESDIHDPNFLERALLYYRRVGIFLMINSFEDSKISFKDAYAIFKTALEIEVLR